MKKLLFDIFCKLILIPAKGKLASQPMFEKMYLISLQGMNYGNGADFSDNGEFNSLKIVRDNLIKNKRALNIFDVGANEGGYVDLLFKVFKKNEIKIYSFEPSKNVFEKLKLKFAKETMVNTFNLGLGVKNEKLTLYKTEKYSGMSSVFQRQLTHFNLEMNEKEEIEIDTIDNFCSMNKIEEIGFLKIDVEGNELNVLKGASKMINDDRISYIQFEFGGTGIDSRTFMQDFYYLLKEKYRIYRIVKDGLFLMENYRETNEIFSLVNFIAEHKSIKR